MVRCNEIGPDYVEVGKSISESQRELLTNRATQPVRKFNRGSSGSAIAKRRPASSVFSADLTSGLLLFQQRYLCFCVLC